MTNNRITVTTFEFRALAIEYMSCKFCQATLAGPTNITYLNLRFKDEV